MDRCCGGVRDLQCLIFPFLNNDSVPQDVIGGVICNISQITKNTEQCCDIFRRFRDLVEQHKERAVLC